MGGFFSSPFMSRMFGLPQQAQQAGAQNASYQNAMNSGLFGAPPGGNLGMTPGGMPNLAGVPGAPGYPGSSMNAAAAGAQPNAGAFSALRGLFGAPQQNATLGQMISGLGGGQQPQPWGGAPAQPNPAGVPGMGALSQQPGGMTPFGANQQQMQNALAMMQQRAGAAQQPPGTATLGGVLSGLLGRGAPGNPMMPGQQPNLAAPPFAGRFRMF